MLLPGYYPTDARNFLEVKKNVQESAIFGLGEIKNNLQFKNCIDVMLEQVKNNFWKSLMNVHHFGLMSKNADLDNSHFGFPLITYLISKNRVDQMCLLLDHCPSFAKQLSTHNWTPLHEAVLQESPKMIHILMRYGADPDVTGTRDMIEYCSDSFGTRSINVNSMVSNCIYNIIPPL